MEWCGFPNPLHLDRHSKLIECMKDVGISEMNAVEDAGSQGSEMDMPFENELDYFDKALDSAEEALNKLENLLQELHLSISNTNKDDLKAACSDLERLRKLKKEAEFLESSLRAKAALLGQGTIDEVPPSSTNKWRWFPNKEAKESESAKRTVERYLLKKRCSTKRERSSTIEGGEELF